jgi:glycosyltransferase involved in cell wall biosynthesis
MLVSAIMPTADRHQLIPSAIKCYLSQTYQNRELVILDDGKAALGDAHRWVKLYPEIRYFRVDCKFISLGEKRNELCRLAQGEIIIHWDDDDWSAPERMQDQVDRLLASGKAVTGYHRILYWNSRLRGNDCNLDERNGAAYQYRHQGRGPYAVGTSQCYLREWALKHPFPEKSYGEDTAFSHRARELDQLTSVDAGKMMVVRVHGANTGHPSLGSSAFPAISKTEIPEAFFEDRI